MSYLIPRSEIDFLLYDWLSTAEFLNRSDGEQHSRETVDALLDLCERLAGDQFLSHYREGDLQEPKLLNGEVRILPAVIKALAHYRDLGLFSAGFAPELGGMGFPSLVCLAAFAQFLAANVSTSAYIMLTTANARLIAAFGSQAQIRQFALPQIEGRWFGTMCLSEPHAGSGLGDIITRAVPDGDDEMGIRYRLSGNKMWISGGDHDAAENIIHLVLAKVAGPGGTLPEGTKGISLFIVPKILPDGQRNDVTVAALNHKMGYHSTSNCALNFGESKGATGWLIGNAGDGLRQMFKMMNEARIVIGLGGAALAWRGYRHAAEYARERTQGRVAGEGGNRPVPIIQHADVRHMLLAQKVYAEGALAVCFYSAKLIDLAGEDGKDDPEAFALLDLLTPVTKTWSSELGLAANDLAIQVHGGFGYTRDFPLEQIYRDNRLNPIHEGTTGIQGIDLVGRKILRDQGHALAVFRARAAATANRAAASVKLSPYADSLRLAVQRIDDTVQRLHAIGVPRALDNATAFLRGFGHVVVGWLWLDMALAAEALDPASILRIGKMLACRYFFETELPRAQTWLVQAGSGSDVVISAPAEIF